MGGTACLKHSGNKFSHALAETCVTLGSGWSHLKGASSEPYISYLPLLCGSTCGVFSCVCWQSGLCPQAWLGQCVLDCTSLCCSSQVWLFKQKPEYLDSLVKYHSCTSGLGRCYVEPRKVNGEGASCCRGLGWESVICFAWEGCCQGYSVPGVEGRCLLNAK